MSWNPIWEDIFSSQEWGKYPGESLIKFVARNFYKQNRSDIKILELGCGPGANLWFCAREGFKIYGIDGSKQAIKKCIKRLDEELPNWEGQIINGSVIDLPFENSFFDAVIDNQCISCLDFENAKLAYAEANKVLKPKGKLFVRTFASGSYGDQTGKKLSKDTWLTNEGNTAGKGPIRFTRYEDLDILLPKEMFKIESIENIKESNKNMKNWTSEWIIEAENSFV
tara:strand:+ start:64 stop:738 length:675 start_codon:yes stop_codon:yes gene_type:complete